MEQIVSNLDFCVTFLMCFLRRKTTIWRFFCFSPKLTQRRNKPSRLFVCRIRQIENPEFFDMRLTSAKMSLLFKSSNVLKRAQAYPVSEFILLNFNYIRLTAIPTAEECHLFLGQLLQHKQQQLVVVTTVSQVLRKCLLEI